MSALKTQSNNAVFLLIYSEWCHNLHSLITFHRTSFFLSLCCFFHHYHTVWNPSLKQLLLRERHCWDQSGIRIIIERMRVSICLGAILIPEYLDFHSSYSAPRSRIARIYSRIYSGKYILISEYPKRTRLEMIAL